MTSMNRPSVKISSGSAKNIRMGRTNALRMPSTSEVTLAASQRCCRNECPCTISTATSTARVLMSQLCRKRRIFFASGCMTFSQNQCPQNAPICAEKQAANKSISVFLLACARASLQLVRACHENSRFFFRRALCRRLHFFALESVVAPGAKLQKLAGDFAFTEGATCDKNGNVFFADQPNNRIMEWSADGKLSTFMQPSPVTRTA